MNKTLATVMGASALATGLLVFAPSQAQASITIYLGGSPDKQDSFSYSEGGISFDVEGYSSSSPDSPGETQEQVTRQLLGLGVSSSRWDNREVDGVGGFETLRFTNFNQLVDLNSITFALVDRGDEFTLFVDGDQIYTDQPIPAGGGFDLISQFVFDPAPTGTEFGISVTKDGCKWSSCRPFSLDNYFVKKIEVHPVPEPLTILGSGVILGFGTFMKRKLGTSKKA